MAGEMNMQNLVNRFEANGIHLWAENGKLKYKAAKELMTSDVLAELKANKEALIKYLSEKEECESVSIVIDRNNRYEPFPLTDVQSAYLLGRNKTFEYGGVACHVYLEIRYPELEYNKVCDIWNAITRKYDMLHAVIDMNGFQQVLKDVPELDIPEWDLLKNPEMLADFEKFRKEMSCRAYTVGKWPMFGLAVSRTKEGATLHLSIEFLLADWTSIWKLMSEFGAAYFDGVKITGEEEVSFRDYLVAEKKLKATAQYEKEKKYWMDRIASLPDAPELPKLPASEAKDSFGRKFLRIPADSWNRMKERAKQYGLTPTVPILSSYADVLAKWSRNKHFCVNMTVLNRLPLHEKVMEIVGDFTSLSLLEVDCNSKENFLARTRKINGQLFADLDNRLFSGVEVMREISRQSKKTGLSMPIVYTSAIGLADSGTPFRGDFSGGISQTPQTFIDCQVMDGSFGLQVNWDYREGVFPEGVLDSMFEAFESRLLALASENSDWNQIDAVALPKKDACERKMANDTKKDWNVRLLQDDFKESVLRTPKKIAVDDGHLQFCFEELDKRAKVVADNLIICGVKPQDCVPVLMEKSAWQVVAVLGILYAGAAYVPIAAAKATGRAEKIVKKMGAKVALGVSVDEPILDGELKTINVDALGANDVAVDYSSFPKGTPDDIAYIIYTSGSTGEPKGVVITHQGAMNTIDDMNDRFDVTANDAVLGLSQLNFDLSVYDLFGVLACGGTVVYPTDENYMNPEAWEALIRKHNITVWNTVPALMKMLLNYMDGKTGAEPLPFKEVFLSGDWIPLDMPERIRKVAPGADVICLGGATEASIWSNYHRYDPNDGLKILPYGRPLANQTMHILDKDLMPCPTMVAGQIALGGDGVALGYYLDEERTAAQFVVLPKTGERVYLTGDIGRYLPGGEIEFLGREDTQVKIRGHRIELGEIENVLKDFQAVKDAVAVVSSDKREIYAAIVTEKANEKTIQPIKQKFKERESVVQQFMADCIDDIDLLQVKAGYEAEEVATAYSILFELQKLGVLEKNKTYGLDEIKSTIISRYHWLVQEWVYFMTIHGFVQQVGEKFVCNIETDENEKKSLWKKAFDVWNSEYIAKDFLEYVKLNVDNLGEVIQGKVDPSQYFYSDKNDKYRYADSMYVNNKIMQVSFKTLTEYLKRVVQENPDKTIRVLEVGAGTGSATRHLLPLLKDYKFEYCFTDHLQHFFPTAAEMFKNYSELTFKKLDLNEDFHKQGFKSNSFDVVVGGYVMDNVADFQKVLEQIEDVLVPQGHFMFLESYELAAWITVTQALLMDIPTEKQFLQQRIFEQLKMSRSEWMRKLQNGEENACVSSFPADDKSVENLRVALYVKQVRIDKQIVDAQKMQEHFDKYLLHYMHPSVVREFSTFPLSTNGKIDRKSILQSFENAVSKSKLLNTSQIEENLKKNLPLQRVAVVSCGKENLVVAAESSPKDSSLVKKAEVDFAENIAKVNQQVSQGQSRFDWEKIKLCVESQEEAAADSMLLTLMQMCILSPDEKFTKNIFVERIPEKYRFHAQEWLNVLLDNKKIILSDKEYKVVAQASDTENVKKWERALNCAVDGFISKDSIRYVMDNGMNLKAFLKGEIDPHVFIYKGYGKDGDKNELQNWSDIMQSCNSYNLLYEYLTALIESDLQKDPKKTLRILELGAGTGQLTKHVYPVLKKSGVSFKYAFTDIYVSFFPLAEEFFKNDSAMSFSRLDINEDFENQGFFENSFDIVLCAGVLDNSKDLKRTLSQIKKTLAPDGFLYVVEPYSDCATMSISQTLMMDKSADALRESYTFLPKQDWVNLVSDADGLGNVACFPQDDTRGKLIGGLLLVKQFKYNRCAVSDSAVKMLLGDIGREKNVSVHILDNLPLKKDGSVDLDSLKRFAKNDKTRRNEDDSIENKLLDIAEKTLNVENIDVEDNFYDFGADSLLMAQMATIIRNDIAPEKTFDAILKVLLDSPTVKDVVRFLKDELQESIDGNENFVQLQRHGTPHGEQARVLLPTVLWSGDMYREIIPALEAQNEGEIFTFRLLNERAFHEINMSEVASVLAGIFAEKIVETQVKKVQLIGYSFNGKLTLELAERLGDAGVEVVDLAIVDGTRVSLDAKSSIVKDLFFADLINVDKEKLGFDLEDFAVNITEYIRETQKKVLADEDWKKAVQNAPRAKEILAFFDLSEDERLKYIRKCSQNYGEKMEYDAFLNLKKTFDMNFNIMVNFKPTPYFGDIRSLLADNNKGILRKANHLINRDWDDLCIGEVTLVQLKGDHFSAFTSKEDALDLADKLSIKKLQESC